MRTLLALAVAVIGMHSLGAGHFDLAIPHLHGVTNAANPAAQLPGHTVAQAPLKWTPTVEASGSSHCSVGECPAAGMDGHGAGHLMSTVCLGVLPALLLLLAWLLLRRTRPASQVFTVWRVLSTPVRGSPPSHLTPSLTKLCVLRT